MLSILLLILIPSHSSARESLCGVENSEQLGTVYLASATGFAMLTSAKRLGHCLIIGCPSSLVVKRLSNLSNCLAELSGIDVPGGAIASGVDAFQMRTLQELPEVMALAGEPVRAHSAQVKCLHAVGH